MTVLETIEKFSTVDARRENISLISSYKGFEIWKYNGSNKGNIVFRYTDFGLPFVVNENRERLLTVLRLTFVRTPFTSVNQFKMFVRDYVVS